MKNVLLNIIAVIVVTGIFIAAPYMTREKHAREMLAEAQRTKVTLVERNRMFNSEWTVIDISSFDWKYNHENWGKAIKVSVIPEKYKSRTTEIDWYSVTTIKNDPGYQKCLKLKKGQKIHFKPAKSRQWTMAYPDELNYREMILDK